jgi:putative lipoprotein
LDTATRAARLMYDTFRYLEMAVMRNHWLAALVALAVLGGCNSADQGTPGRGDKPVAPAIAPGTTITGTVTFHDPVEVGAGSKLDVKLVDVAQPEIAIAEKSSDVSGAAPFNFSLDFDPARIAASRTYVINAVLTDGPRRFLPALNSPVLTHGAGTTTQVVLNPEPTPAEKLAEECSQLEKHIGAMKKVDGTYTTEDSSVGWDAFAESGHVRYVRVNTDLDKGGHNSVNYGYKDDKPMCAKQPGGVRAPWSVGWSDSGEVGFSRKPGGGELSEADAKALYDGATHAYQMAQERVDASRKK